jgi:hypothetical protein
MIKTQKLAFILLPKKRETKTISKMARNFEQFKNYNSITTIQNPPLPH